jgi:hypothetical protein
MLAQPVEMPLQRGVMISERCLFLKQERILGSGDAKMASRRANLLHNSRQHGRISVIRGIQGSLDGGEPVLIVSTCCVCAAMSEVSLFITSPARSLYVPRRRRRTRQARPHIFQ